MTFDIASDDAIFFADYLQQEGIGWYVNDGKFLLCRMVDGIWHNALVQTWAEFPESERREYYDAKGSLGSILWIEPDSWKPLDLAPNMDRKQATDALVEILMKTRLENWPSWDFVMHMFSGRTHREGIKAVEDLE